MLRISFNGTDKQTIAALQSKAPQLRSALQRTMDELMLDLQARVQRKLSGEVLQSHRGVGGLLGTVRKEPTVSTDSQIVGRVTAGGGQFWWAVVHEEGGKKTYTILPGAVTGKSDKKALAFFPTGSVGAGFGATALTRIKFKSGKRRGELRPNRLGEFKAAGGIVVKKVIHPPLPKRSFMQSSLDEMRADIIRRVYASAAKAIRP
jgi:hypothetical protein